jgi:hypothetical protein
MHRQLFLCVSLTSDHSHSCSFYDNKTFVEASGVLLTELNVLELDMLFKLDFRLNISTEVVELMLDAFEDTVWRCSLKNCQPDDSCLTRIELST